MGPSGCRKRPPLISPAVSQFTSPAPSVFEHDEGSAGSRLDSDVVRGDGRIADRHSLLRADMHIGQSDRRDRTFRKANDESGSFGASRAQIRDADVVKAWGEPRDRLRRVLVQHPRVVFR